MRRLPATAATLGLLATLAACSSDKPAGDQANQGTAGPSGSIAFPTGPTSAPATSAGNGTGSGNGSGNSGGNGGGNGGGGGGGGGSTSPSTTTPTSAPTGQPKIDVYQATAGPTCGNASSKSLVTLTWRTTGATEVWLLISQVAFETGDPKTSGGIGPLPTTGTRQFPYDCVNENLYYKLRAYNPSHEKDPTGINLQVPRDA
jgi:hypothetical protein